MGAAEELIGSEVGVMRSAKWITLALVAMLGFVAPAFARPLDVKKVPADVKWLIHIDVDALVASSVWKIADAQLQKNPELQTGIATVEMITGAKLPKDLHDITVLGKAFGPDAPVVLISATINKDQLLALLQGNVGYSVAKYGPHDVHSWDDKGKTMYGSFHTATQIVMGQDKDQVHAALDLLDGKTPCLKADAALASGAGAGIIAYIAGEGLAQLQDGLAKSPLVQQMETAWVSLGEAKDTLVLKATIAAKTALVAEQIRASVEGIKAFVTLAAANEKADPKLKAAASALQNLAAKAQDKQVSVEVRVPIAALKDMVENGLLNQKTDGAKGG
jgi:hypothetical protein